MKLTMKFEWTMPELNKTDVIDPSELLYRLSGYPQKSQMINDLMNGKSIKTDYAIVRMVA